MSFFIKFCGLIACFLFASGFASGAARAHHEKKWTEFGMNLTLTACFWFGICFIMQLWCGV